MNRLNGLSSVLKDQSETIERLNMDYAVERTLLAGVLAGLSARSLLGIVNFEKIEEVAAHVGDREFVLSLTKRIEMLRATLPV